MTTSAWRVPRRDGQSVVVTVVELRAVRRTRWHDGVGARDGGHASRTSRVMCRFVVLVRRSVAVVVWSARIGPVTSRRRRRVRGEGAPAVSIRHAAMTRPNHVQAKARDGERARGTMPTRTMSALRAETITGASAGDGGGCEDS